MGFGEQIGMQAAEGAVGGVMGLALGGIENQRQLKQQGKLQKLQLAGNREMLEMQRQKEMQMWKDTNYGAQMKMLDEAGLNPAMIYGMSGGGGQTVGGGGGGVQGATAQQSGAGGMAMQMASMALMDAQKKNIEADTQNKLGDAANKPLVGKNLEASTGNTIADTKLKEIQTRIQGIEAEIAGRTIEDKVDIITAEASSAITDSLRVQRQNKIEEATMQITMDKLKADYIGVLLNNANTKADTGLKGAQTATERERPAQIRTDTHATASNIVQKWRGLELEGQKLTNEQLKMYMGDEDISGDIVDAIQSILLMRAAGGMKTNPKGAPKGYQRTDHGGRNDPRFKTHSYTDKLR